METYKKIGINGTLFNRIILILSANRHIKKAVVFGSRARSFFKAASDIDLAIYSKFISSKEINIIKNTLEELPTALKFDLVYYDNINNRKLKKNIDKEGILIYEK